jgi:hypothetical protein
VSEGEGWLASAGWAGSNVLRRFGLVYEGEVWLASTDWAGSNVMKCEFH